MEDTKLIKIANSCYFDESSSQVLVENKPIKLTISQTKLIKILAKNLNRPIASVDLYFEVWEDYQKEYNEKSVRNLMSSLRKSLPMIHIKSIYGGFYALQREEKHPDSHFKEYLFEFLDQAQNGIVITDPNQNDNPIIYINSAYTDLFGYTLDEIKGKNCRFMHGTDKEQLALQEIKQAIKNQASITVNVRNYTKCGMMIYNEVTISPIFDKQTAKLRYFLGVHKDVTLVHNLRNQLSNTEFDVKL